MAAGPVECFEVYDAAGNRVGLARRAECHGNPRLLHRTAHVAVFNARGEVLLQKRSARKDTQPGKWDTAVGGHLAPGETWEQAARREMTEELGIRADYPLRFLFRTAIRNAVESEDVAVFAARHDGPFRFPPEEIDDVRFWTPAELLAGLGSGRFTPNLEEEIARLREAGELPR